MHKKLKPIQYIIFFNLLVVFGFLYIYLLESNSPLVRNYKYTNPLMINKSIDYNIKNKDFNKFMINLNLKNTNINIPNHKGITLLMKCIINKCDNIYLDELIIKSDKEYTNNFSETPIHYSIIFDNFEAFKKLIKKGFILSKYKDKSLLDIVKKSNIKQRAKYLIILNSMKDLK